VTALEVRGLSVSYAHRAILSDVAFDLRKGEILAVVGKSGSGKSTLVQALAGLLPRRAVARSQGLPALVPGRGAGVVFQEPEASLDPLFRCGDQIAEVVRAGKGLRGRELRERVAALLARAGLEPPERFARAYPHQLSGGECQRVNIAAAIALDPPVLLADEPTSALDTAVEAQVLRLLRDLTTRSGLATLLVTHDFDVVAEVADRVAVLSGGRIVEERAVFDVLRSPREEATRELLAARLGAPR
jgi:peptide/nickel transport system ATP-binding protein